MSWWADPPDDRALPPIDDATAESLLTGGEVRSDLEPVAAFLRALRDTARRRVAPGARLAAHMAGGRYAGQSPAPWSGGRLVAAPPTALTTRRLVAWASVGAVVAAMLGTATAGFARSLPEPAQQRFEVVVTRVTGYEFPDAPDGCGAPDDRPDTDDSGDPGDTGGTAAPAGADRDHPGRAAGRGPESDRPAPFGAWVRSLGAGGPGHGKEVGARARTWAGSANKDAAANPGAAKPGAAGKPDGKANGGPHDTTVDAGPPGAGPVGAKPGGPGGPAVPASTADQGGPSASGSGPAASGGGPPAKPQASGDR